MIIDIVFGVVICYLLIVVNRLTKAIHRMNSGYGEALTKLAKKLEDVTIVTNYQTTKITEYEEYFSFDALELCAEFELLDRDEDPDEDDEDNTIH